MRMEQRIDRIERAIEEMIKSRESDRAIVDQHSRILANLEASQIVMQYEIKSLRNDFKAFTRAMNDIADAFKYKIDNHEERIDKLENK